jgi:choline dehydrogenase-like flavoprotein
MLGWRAEPATINARGCVRSGFCGYGCRYDAKQGTLLTYLPRAFAAGARLYADVRAERVELLERGASTRLPRKRVTASVLDRATGRVRGTVTAEAPVVILAGGAVGTPVLLQRSGMGGGGVGEWLRLHPTTAVVGLYDRTINGAGGIPLSAMCDEFVRRDADGYGYWIECPPLHPMLAAAAVPGFGAEHAACMRDFRRLGSTIALVRDGADRDLSNGSVRALRGGGTSLRYRLGPRDRAHFVESMAAAARLHLACGAREVRTLHTRPVVARTEADLAEIRTRSVAPNDVALFSAHVNGTCRMGRDPRTSGVTPDLAERHGVRGLFVGDGSILPTSLGVNPQETIMALATVLAGRIADLG